MIKPIYIDDVLWAHCNTIHEFSEVSIITFCRVGIIAPGRDSIGDLTNDTAVRFHISKTAAV